MRQKRYVIGTPYDMDQSKFSYLVEKCKGEDSIRGFAAKCKISKAIISNILNGVYKAPCSMHTIYAIYENRASGCEVTLDDLMTADGYVVEEEIIKPIYDIDPAFRGCARGKFGIFSAMFRSSTSTVAQSRRYSISYNGTKICSSLYGNRVSRRR